MGAVWLDCPITQCRCAINTKATAKKPEVSQQDFRDGNLRTLQKIKKAAKANGTAEIFE